LPLGRALDSVLAQTDRDFEVIVVDDASPTDSAERVVIDRADARIQYIKFPSHRGVSAARNAGVQAAAGEYVAFLDDDDEWLPEKIERQLRAIERGGASVCAVYTARFTIDGNSGRTTITRYPERFRAGDDNAVTTSSILIRRECLKSVGEFDEELETSEDFDMWIRLAEHFEFAYLDAPLVRYYVHSGSLSTDYPKKRRSQEKLLARHGRVFARNRRNLAREFTSLGRWLYYEGKVKEAVCAYWRALRACPWEIHTYSAAIRLFARLRTLRLMFRPGSARMR